MHYLYMDSGKQVCGHGQGLGLEQSSADDHTMAAHDSCWELKELELSEQQSSL